MPKMIPNYIYFYHLDKFCVLPLYPEAVADQLGSRFSSTNALSRTAPVFSYIESGPRSFTVTLKLHRDLMNDLNSDISNFKANVEDPWQDDYIDVLAKNLQAVALPRYKASSKSVTPPVIALRFGSDIFIKGVVNNGVTVTYEMPILVGNKYAVVNFNFTVSEVDPYDADSVLEVGSFRGLAACNNIYTGGVDKKTAFADKRQRMRTEAVARDFYTNQAVDVANSLTKSMSMISGVRVPGPLVKPN